MRRVTRPAGIDSVKVDPAIPSRCTSSAATVSGGRTVLASGRSVVVLIAINDLTADGRDISWLWDVDFEMLRGSARVAVVTGLRAEDMAVRLKYAGLDEGVIRLEKDEQRAIHLGLEQLAAGEPLYVLPTYTALLRIRKILARRGHVKAFWED